MSIVAILALAICAALFAYLTFALLRGERL
jgi:K+-transporting ATPase KdpF subunit